MPILICLVLAVAAFAQTPSNEAQVATGGSKVPTCASELERSTRSGTPAEDCLLGIGDAVYVNVWRDCTWGPSVIGPDGTVVRPLIGKVQAANLTISQLAESLQMLLSNYLNDPRVTVTLADTRKQPKYYVDGHVVRPGEYSLLAHVTVLEAIDKAEGFRSAAHNHKISVVRGADAVLRLDYKGMLRHPERNVAIQNGDHVIVLQ